MLRTIPAAVASLLVVAGAAAQQAPIQWSSNSQQAVAQAQRTKLPLLFYVTEGKGEDDNKAVNAQQRALRDPLVVSVVRQRFVPLRMARSSDNVELLRQMGAPTEYGNYLLVVTPDGNLVGRLGAEEVARANTLATRLTELFRRYRSDMFNTQLKPLIEIDSPKPADVKSVLTLVKNFIIVEADADVAKLLDKPALNKNLRRDVYMTLAELSTKPSVEALVKAAGTDKLAVKSLESCLPIGAEHMLPIMETCTEDEFLMLYEAATKICRMKAKTKAFWFGENNELKSAEFERVKQEVRAEAKRWRDQFGDFR